jgi:hypothetical protein
VVGWGVAFVPLCPSFRFGLVAAIGWVGFLLVRPPLTVAVWWPLHFTRLCTLSLWPVRITRHFTYHRNLPASNFSRVDLIGTGACLGRL